MDNINAQGGASVDQLLQMGIDTAKQGNKEGARVLLRQVIQRDQRNDRAWMWLAYVEADPVQRRRYLENAVRINPSNKAAQKALNKLKTSKTRSQRQIMLLGGAVLAGLILISALACLVVLSIN